MPLSWELSEKTFDLKRTWSIARGQVDSKTLSFIRVSGENTDGLGEASCMTGYPYTYKEIREQFEGLQRAGFLDRLDSNQTPESVESILTESELHPPLRFAMTSAFTHWVCKRRGITLARFLGLELPRTIGLCYSIPMVSTDQIPEEVRRAEPFKWIKVKVHRETMVDVVSRVGSMTQKPLIVDANESWEDVAAFVESSAELRRFNIAFYEQPFSSSTEDPYEEVFRKSPAPIVLDESIETCSDYDRLKPCLSGVNVKLQKSGSYLEGLRILKAAKKDGKIAMLGCSIETGLGIWGASHLASLCDYSDLDGALLLKEDPHGNRIEYINGALLPHQNF